MTDPLRTPEDIPFADGRVAFVHDWLNGMRGGELVLEQLLPMWPLAEIHTLFYEPHRVSDRINGRAVYPSILQRLPGTRRGYRHLLPLFPWAMRRMDLSRYDMVISISHCAAKAAPVPEGVPHVCYCLTPARYLYDQADAYFGRGPAGALKRALAGRMRRWDRDTAWGVWRFFSNSEYVARRIRRVYAREAVPIHSPIDTAFYTPPPPGVSPRADYYLTVCAAVPYKRVDLIVEAFNVLGKKLVFVGKGPELPRLRRMAGSNIEFRPWVGRRELRELYRHARAFVFAAEEDFGLTPIEAQACGCPAIALGKGGALETVVAGKTGLFFEEQSRAALIEAVRRFNPRDYDPRQARANAERFSPQLFRRHFVDALRKAVQAGGPNSDEAQAAGR